MSKIRNIIINNILKYSFIYQYLILNKYIIFILNLKLNKTIRNYKIFGHIFSLLIIL